MHLLPFLCLLTILPCSWQSLLTAYAPLSPEIILHGRYYMADVDAAFDWSCFQIDFCFQDTKQVTVNLVDTWNIYQIVIDGGQGKNLHPKKAQSHVVFQSDKPESHCIQIIKITENHYGPIASHKDSRFKGVQIDGGSLIRNSKKYDYKFEFLGDSVTTAFGVLSGRNPICFLRMKGIQNCRESWAVHLSNMFNADYRLQAVSGKGVVRNAFGVPGAKMPSLFSRTTDNSKQNSYKIEDRYVPDAVLLFIGANDYNNIKNPSMGNFVDGYVEMLQKIAKDYMIYTDRNPKLISICDSEFNRELCYNVRTAVKSFAYAYRSVYYVEIPEGTVGKQDMGCIGHPNTKGQRKIAEAVYEGVKQILLA